MAGPGPALSRRLSLRTFSCVALRAPSSIVERRRNGVPSEQCPNVPCGDRRAARSRGMPRKQRSFGPGIRIALSPGAMMIRLFDKAIDRLATGLEYTSRRHEVLAKNVANMETPGYKALDVT